ncbi:MAG: YdeI family protein [Vulcanimicrobiota bacterium]
MKTGKELYVKDRDEWRSWLEQNSSVENEIWLVYYKKHSGKPRIPYDDAVEEAICFGWIDSIVQRIDDEKFLQKFTPRKKRSSWSELNIKRARKMIEEEKMTAAGLSVLDESKLNKKEDSEVKQSPEALAVPEFFREALMTNEKALQNFNRLTCSYRNLFIRWISAAQKEETRNRRILESIELLAQGRKLGMK